MSKANSKYYTMQEMAGKVGVNKSTVYRYLLKEGIAPATTKRNTNLYNATTLQRVKEHFSKKNSNNSEKKAPNDLLIETLRQQVSSLQNEISNLIFEISGLKILLVLISLYENKSFRIFFTSCLQSFKFILYFLKLISSIFEKKKLFFMVFFLS